MNEKPTRKNEKAFEMTSAPKKDEKPFTFRPVEHTADYCLEIEARSLEDLFRGAAVGMMETICGRPDKAQSEMEIVVCGNDLEELLVAWLNELLYLWEESGVWFYDAPKLELRKERLLARIRFARWLPGAASSVDVAIKAATYGGLHIEKKQGAFRARVTFDT